MESLKLLNIGWLGITTLILAFFIGWMTSTSLHSTIGWNGVSWNFKQASLQLLSSSSQSPK
jgi:hypothetical protein